jgi:hypothetical protein
MSILDLQYRSTEAGFARINFTAKSPRNPRVKLYYCFQEEYPGIWSFYRTSKDGEPDHTLDMGDIRTIELPKDNSGLTKELKNFVATFNIPTN